MTGVEHQNAHGEIEIRSGGPEDLGAVIRLEKAAFSDPWSQEALFGELLPDSLRMPLIAEVDGTLCGYLMAWRVVDQLHILNIATDPALLRRGIGTKMLLVAGRLAAAAGLVEITLEVRRSNTSARRFYNHHHFVEMGVRPGYYQDNGEDAIVMTAVIAEMLAD